MNQLSLTWRIALSILVGAFFFDLALAQLPMAQGRVTDLASILSAPVRQQVLARIQTGLSGEIFATISCLSSGRTTTRLESSRP